MTERVKAGQAIVDVLKAEGVKAVFGMPGGHVLGIYWLYVVGPVAGTLAVLALWRLTPALARLELTAAKLYHFEHDPHGLFGLNRQERRAGSRRPMP